MDDLGLFYLRSFEELSSGRQQGLSPGPIPWRDIRDFAVSVGLEDDALSLFCRVIRDLDNAYMVEKAEEAEQKKNEKQSG